MSSVSLKDIDILLYVYIFIWDNNVCICVCGVFLHLCIFVSTVSEPTLKWKLKKLISTRPNPLQRKISAPPAVKHRTETLGRVIYINLDLFLLFPLLFFPSQVL